MATVTDDRQFRYRAYYPAFLWVVAIPITGAIGVAASAGIAYGGAGLIVAPLLIVLFLGAMLPWLTVYGYGVSVDGSVFEWRAAIRKTRFPVSGIISITAGQWCTKFHMADGSVRRLIVRARGFQRFVGALGDIAPHIQIEGGEIPDGWGLADGFIDSSVRGSTTSR
jgi:hypothetical protein